MSSPVLVLSNDFSLAAAKTSRHLCRALERLGCTAVGRDTRLIRWAAAEAAKEHSARCAAYEQTVIAKWNKLIFDYGFETVISLDLHWLLSENFLLPNEGVRAIHSIWFDDLRSHFQSAPMFPPGAMSPLELINAPKVWHHCYGRGQMEELRLLGVQQVRASALAAPSEYLEADAPCEITERLAFIGNPGLAAPPTARGLQALERGNSLASLRKLARHEILDGLTDAEPAAAWLRGCAQVADLLATATELRLDEPFLSAMALLVRAGKAHPAAFDFLNRTGAILDAAMLVKFVNRYDRPGLVRRLWKRGWLDVFGTPEQWKPYGISAQSTVSFPRLAVTYRRYAAHLNAPNCARDASANEKLFEIAACGRLSLNLDSPDVRACYSEREVRLEATDEAIEAAAAEILKDPSAALASGDRARARTAKEHLWEHRLEGMLA